MREARGEQLAKGVQAVFVALCAFACALPLVGMLWAPTTQTTENRELAQAPVLIEDGGLNVDFLADAGAYFEDHFAYRNELVSLNAELRVALFGVSPADSVVAGTDGWLYYAGTLSDYCGWDALSERAAQNIAFNLLLMQGYCEAQGASFVLAVAPNKNSVYAQNMPYWYWAGTGESGWDLVRAALAERGVASVDLFSAFEECSSEDTLYYLRDSHWNTKGALLAFACIEDALGHDGAADKAAALEPLAVEGYVGDLNAMLYPTTAEPEADWSYEESLDWSYAEGSATDESWIQTSGSGEGTLIMFRDSFANNMLQFFADAYGTAYFSKYVPYDLTQVGALGATTVVVERAERHLSDLAENPAVMPAPTVALGNVEAGTAGASSQGVELTEDGAYVAVQGTLPQEFQGGAENIYIGLEGEDGVTWYVPFHVSDGEGDYGYKAYISAEAIGQASAVWVLTGEGDDLACAQYTTIR